MSRAAFTKAAVQRAVAGAIAAGLKIGRIEIEIGKIVVHAAQPEQEPKSPLDEWRAGRDTR